MINKEVIFKDLKFVSTSFNHGNAVFYKVIVVYIKEENDEHPKIICSAISPSIFVDSRKYAMDIFFNMEVKINSFALPFLPEIINK